MIVELREVLSNVLRKKIEVPSVDFDSYLLLNKLPARAEGKYLHGPQRFEMGGGRRRNINY